MFPVSPKIWAMVLSATLTEGSVHLRRCAASRSYLDAPAVRMYTFSKMSVSGQPSPPSIEKAGVPEARSVLALASSCVQVAGGFTPAFLKAATEYQIVDLLAPLNTMPASSLTDVTREIHACA